ncbi:hypothetical protein FRC00_012006, partial [Tulasnella sp. 408]
AARVRRNAAKTSRGSNPATQPSGNAEHAASKDKPYTLDRYKLHALGDYPSQIRLFGSLDVISTQMGEARHRQKKRQYARSNKRNFENQIATQTKIAENIRFIESMVNAAMGIVLDKQPPAFQEFQAMADSDSAPLGSPEKPYWIADVSRVPINLSQLLQSRNEDPAFKHFRVQFLDHVLARLRGYPYSWDEPVGKLKEYSGIELEKDRIYAHGTAQFNYTTYDIRRGQDTIKPALRFTGKGSMVEPENSVRSTIMLSADETDGVSIRRRRFWYARVMGIFHCRVRDRTKESTEWIRMDMLWVRWFGADPDERCGLKVKRLERVGYVPETEGPGGFGFVDPTDVIRACHLSPAFDHGTRRDLFSSSQSVAFDMKTEDGGEDYELYYVLRFSDRDMAMRHRGGGIGHVDAAQRAEGEAYDENDGNNEAGDSEDPIDDLGQHSEERGSDREAEPTWPVDGFDSDDDGLLLEDENGSDADDVFVGFDDD